MSTMEFSVPWSIFPFDIIFTLLPVSLYSPKKRDNWILTIWDCKGEKIVFKWNNEYMIPKLIYVLSFRKII